MKRVKVIGIMSGSSLDGLDVDLSEFWKKEGRWSYCNLHSSTVDFPKQLRTDLQESSRKSPEELEKLNVELGKWIGKSINDFLINLEVEPDLISSHGHTVFHSPDQKQTLQIGDGKQIAQLTGLPTVCNFREEDVIKGGQGAPIVTIGEKLLLRDYKVFLNLGGISNISLVNLNQKLAFDIAPCNQVLNHFASFLGKEYDENGTLASRGKIDEKWITYLNSLVYFLKEPPKSLGNDFLNGFVLTSSPKNPEDALNTYVIFLANQLAEICDRYDLSGEKLLVSGGGARNGFLIEQINHRTGFDVIVAGEHLLEFKEAMIFGFLGALRWFEETNILSDYTGAESDSSSGTIYFPSNN